MKRRTPTTATVPSRDDFARLADATVLRALLEAREVYQAPGVHREHAEYRDLDAAIHHLRGALTLDVLLRFGRKAASTCPACDAPDGDHALHCPRATEAP